jgi:hypothetical protein
MTVWTAPALTRREFGKGLGSMRGAAGLGYNHRGAAATFNPRHRTETIGSKQRTTNYIDPVCAWTGTILRRNRRADTLMPQVTEDPIASAFGQLQKQVQQLLAKLQSEIRSKEADLRRLKEEESNLSNLIGLRRTDRARATTSGLRGATARIDWGRVLEQIPKQFTAADVRKVREVANKRPSEIFAAITRWIESRTVKRKERGLYERVK